MQRPVQKEAIRPYMPAPPSKAKSMGEFFGALSQQGQQWYSTLKEREAFEQFNRAQVDTLTDESAYGQWQRKNSATPDTDLVQYDNSMEASRQKIRGYLTNGVALRRWEAWEKLRDVPRREAALGNMVKISDEARLARFSEGLIDAAIIKDEQGNPVLNEQGNPTYDWNNAKQIVTNPAVLKEMGISLKEADTALEDVMSQVKIQQEQDNAITNQKVRSQFYEDIDSIMTGAKSKEEVLADLEVARVGDYSDPNNPIKPTLDEKDSEAIEKAIHTEYQQAYGGAMSQVGHYARGLLLNPDSLGYIKNAPIRYKILGDFNQAWHNWIAQKGDKLKISEIYPEGIRLATMHQISDEEAERQEIEMNEMLRQREAKRKMTEVLGREPTPVDIRNAELMKVPPPDFNAPEEVKKEQWEAFRAAAAEMKPPETKAAKRKKLTRDIQVKYLRITNGDVEEAKRLAAEDGYYE